MNNFTLDDIKNLIEQCLKEEPTGDSFIDARYQEQIKIIGHTNPYYKLFYLLSKTLKPEFVVELGSWQATGAAHFAAGNPDGFVVTVDIHREDKIAQQRAIEASAHYSNLMYINGWTWDNETVETISLIGKPIEILFIDAWHDYDLCKKEWALYQPLLAPTALVIADDITTAYNFDGMLKFWDEMPEPKFLDDRIHPGIPMGFTLLKGTEFDHVDENRTASEIEPVTLSKRGRPRKES